MYVSLNPLAVHQKLTQHCKSILVQLKKIKFHVCQLAAEFLNQSQSSATK